MQTKEIAKQIRIELKEKFKSGKFSVTTDSYTGGSSLNVSLMKHEKMVIADGSDYIQVNHYYIDDAKCLTEEGKSIMSGILNIINKFHWDKSEIETDYFNCNFYIHLNVGKWDKPFQLTA